MISDYTLGGVETSTLEPMTQKNEKREFTGLRMDAQLRRRLIRVAKKDRSSMRSVIEKLVDKGLPELEREFGIDPDQGEGQDAK